MAVVEGPPEHSSRGLIKGLEYLSDPLSYLARVPVEYGGIVKFRFFRRQVYLVTDPESVKQVLVTDAEDFPRGRSAQVVKNILGPSLLTSAGQEHLNQRRVLQKAFRPTQIQQYAAIAVDHAAALCDRWHREGVSNAFVDREMMRLTLGVMAKSVFSADFEHDAQVFSDIVETFDMMERFVNPPLGPILAYMPLYRNFRFLRARRRLLGLFRDEVDQRQRNGDRKDDLISRILEANGQENGAPMSADELAGHILALLFAGHETTAIWIAWTWYLLGQYPEVEARLHEELAEVLGNRLPTFEDLPRLDYMRKVLTETLRVYPPAYILERVAARTMTVGDYVIPKGSMIFLSPYASHRDPRFYPEPERFDPERWTDEEKEKRPRFSFFPFAAGPHLCIGEPMAWMEATLILAATAQRYTMRPDPNHKVITVPRVTLRAKTGIRMILERR